jgi:hypothetical protein
MKKNVLRLCVLFLALLSLLPLGIGTNKASANSISDWYWTENKHMSSLSTGSAVIKFNQISASSDAPVTGSAYNAGNYGYDVYAQGPYSGNSVTWGNYSAAPMPNIWDHDHIAQLVGWNGFIYRDPYLITVSYYLHPGETVYFHQQSLHKIVDVAYVETDRNGKTVYESHMILDIIHYQGPSITRYA